MSANGNGLAALASTMLDTPADCRQTPTQAASGATPSPLAEGLHRLAELREEEARILRNIAEDLDLQLADAVDSRLMEAMETVTGQPTSGTPDPMLSTERVGELLDLTPRTIRRLEKKGDLPPARRIGGVLRWREADIRTWMGEAG